VARTPPERTLAWVLGVIGAGARIVETRTLHGDEPPWQLRIEHSSGTKHAVLRIPTPPGINASMVATGAAALELAERQGPRDICDRSSAGRGGFELDTERRARRAGARRSGNSAQACRLRGEEPVVKRKGRAWVGAAESGEAAPVPEAVEGAAPVPGDEAGTLSRVGLVRLPAGA
jgi:hypothetical protein